MLSIGINRLCYNALHQRQTLAGSVQ